MSWLSQCADGSVVIALHIQPGAKRTELVGLHGEALKIRLAAPPVDGKANAALLAFLAQQLGLSKRELALESGEASRQKRVRISGASAERVAALLAGNRTD